MPRHSRPIEQSHHRFGRSLREWSLDRARRSRGDERKPLRSCRRNCRPKSSLAMPSIAYQTTRPKCRRTIVWLMLLLWLVLLAAQPHLQSHKIITPRPISQPSMRAESPAYQPRSPSGHASRPTLAAFPASSVDKPLLLPPRSIDSSYEKSGGGSRTLAPLSASPAVWPSSLDFS